MVNEIIGRISRGTKMDQIYLSRTRKGLEPGEYVLITPLDRNPENNEIKKPFFYDIKKIEPIKLTIINEIFLIVEKYIKDYDNLIITGSFLETGFCFKDVDILILIKSFKYPENKLKEIIENKIKISLGIKPHLILLDNKSLTEGLATDPLYQSMLSRCISKKRFFYKIEPKINYKLLDLHLLKSKLVIDAFDVLTGDEKYYYTQNMIAIYLFIKNVKVTKLQIEKEIKISFELSRDKIKENLMDKKVFLKKYKQIYSKVFDKIMEGVGKQNGSK